MEEAQGLALVSCEGDLELVDRTLGTWLVRIEAVPDATPSSGSSATSAAVVRSLCQAVPGLAAKLPTGGIRVVFSPEVRKGLASGTYRMMESSKGALPMAVDGSGKVVQIAKVAGGTKAGIGGGVALGGAAVAMWPLALAAGVAMAVSWQEQRWLEKSLAGLRSAVQRLETRLRDDDFGRLEAADHLVELLADDVLDGPLPPQFREELAVARRDVEAIYASRKRYVDRFKRRLEDRQTAHESKTGERVAWQDETVKEVADPEAGVTDELTLFVMAMMTRARVGAVTAAQLSTTGDPIRAVRLVEQLHGDLARDYHDLHNRVAALARHDVDLARWRRLTGVGRGDAERAIAALRALDDAMEHAVGAQLPPRDEELVLELVADAA
jgi:hypothetical protein